MTRTRQPLLLVLVSAMILGGASLLGCNETTRAEQLCLDSAQAVAAAWERCGYDPEAKLQDVLFELRECEDVVQIRDEDTLVGQCFPALTTLDCTDLEAGTFPDPCVEQILF